MNEKKILDAFYRCDCVYVTNVLFSSFSLSLLSVFVYCVIQRYIYFLFFGLFCLLFFSRTFFFSFTKIASRRANYDRQRWDCKTHTQMNGTMTQFRFRIFLLLLLVSSTPKNFVYYFDLTWVDSRVSAFVIFVVGVGGDVLLLNMY